MTNIETIKAAGDGTAVAVVIGWLINILPGIATLLTVIWMAIRIWETDTVKGWRKRFGKK